MDVSENENTNTCHGEENSLSDPVYNLEVGEVLSDDQLNSAVSTISTTEAQKANLIFDLQKTDDCTCVVKTQFFEVGLPAKSSVSGAMILVVPNVMGISMFSPPIDQYGNSIKCRVFCEELLKEFIFHPFEQIGHAVVNKKNPLRFHGDLAEMNIIKLLFYASAGDLIALKRFYLMGFDMMKTDYDGRTALHLAAAEGHLDCVKFLLEVCKVPHNPADRWGHVPKGEANTFGHTDVFNYLRNWELEHGQQKNPVNKEGSE